MAVVQPNKEEVRPVLDYRDVNEFVLNKPRSCNVVKETLSRWRHLGNQAALLDLQRTYLQIKVHDALSKHQAV